MGNYDYSKINVSIVPMENYEDIPYFAQISHYISTLFTNSESPKEVCIALFPSRLGMLPQTEMQYRCSVVPCILQVYCGQYSVAAVYTVYAVSHTLTDPSY